jgi:hypothetical protein
VYTTRVLGVLLVALPLIVGACSSSPSAPGGGSGAVSASAAAGGGGRGQTSPPAVSSSAAASQAGGGGGSAAGGADAMPCDKLGSAVTQITGLSIASVDSKPDDCSFVVNTSGDSATNGFGGVVDIRRESDDPADLESVDRLFVGGPNAIDVQGVGDKAVRNQSGSLMYAVHNDYVWAVQQELLVTGQDLPGNANKLMLALFGLV